MATGAHRNVKKFSKKSRVTIPKRKYNRKYIREAMDVITKHSKPSPNTNKTLTTRDLAKKGFDHKQVIKVANELEENNIDRIKTQFTDKNALKIGEKVEYRTARQSLHNYLHSFAI